MDRKEEIVLKLKSFFKQKAKEYHVQVAFLYGSWATGYPRGDSDVDIAILFSTPLSDNEIFELINTLSLNASETLAKEVNILPVYEDFPKPMLYYNAIVLGIPVYIGDFNRYVELKLQAISQMEDFSIFGIRWQLEVAKKNLEALRHV